MRPPAGQPCDRSCDALIGRGTDASAVDAQRTEDATTCDAELIEAFAAYTKRIIITQVEFAIGHAEEQTNKLRFLLRHEFHYVQLTRE